MWVKEGGGGRELGLKEKAYVLTLLYVSTVQIQIHSLQNFPDTEVPELNSGEVASHLIHAHICRKIFHRKT